MHFSRGPQQGYSTSFSPCLEETDERGVVVFFLVVVALSVTCFLKTGQIV